MLLGLATATKWTAAPYVAFAAAAFLLLEFTTAPAVVFVAMALALTVAGWFEAGGVLQALGAADIDTSG